MTNTDTADADAHGGCRSRGWRMPVSEYWTRSIPRPRRAAAVPEIVSQGAGLGAAVPIVGDPSTPAATSCFPTTGGARRLRQVPHQRRQRRAGAVITTTTSRPSSGWRSRNGKRSGSGVTGLARQRSWLTLMDANDAGAEPQGRPGRVMSRRWSRAAIRSAELAEATGLCPRPNRPFRKVVGRPRPHRRLPSPGGPLRLSAPPGSDRGGMGMKGIVASSAGLSLLLAEGNRRHDPGFDHARARRRPDRGGGRRTAGPAITRIRSFMPQVSSCPGCGRTTSVYFQELARDVQTYLRDQMPLWRERHPGVEELRVAVMGCVSNGPGESKHAGCRQSACRHVRRPGGSGLQSTAPWTAPSRRPHRRGFKAILDSYVERRFPAVGQQGKEGRVDAGTASVCRLCRRRLQSTPGSDRRPISWAGEAISRLCGTARQLFSGVQVLRVP